MSQISFRPVGCEEGIEVTNLELELFATKMNSEFVDKFIPLPKTSFVEQVQLIKTCKVHGEDVVFDAANNDVEAYETDEEADEAELYWETETGSHGWCCKDCGTVVQWG